VKIFHFEVACATATDMSIYSKKGHKIKATQSLGLLKLKK
jgi:hypothetical protein